MALLFMDGFDHYATADIPKKWYYQSSETISPNTGRRSGGTMYGNTGDAMVLITPATDTIILGGAFKSSAFSTYAPWIAFASSDGKLQSGVSVMGTGDMRAFRNINGQSVPASWDQIVNGTLLGSTRLGALTTGAWYYIEVKICIHASAGTVEIRINGVTELSVTGVNTRGSGAEDTGVSFVQIKNHNVDDFYICDSSGAENNDFLGDVRVDAHYPIADGATHEWTPSTGSDNYALVDEVAPNTTDYNSTNTLNAVDTLVVEDLKNTGARICGVQMSIYHSKEDAGACLVAPVVRPVSTNIVGADFAPSAGSYNYVRAVHGLNPATGLAWSESTFNATEFGYKKTG